LGYRLSSRFVLVSSKQGPMLSSICIPLFMYVRI
jgi:hypothetical protein